MAFGRTGVDAARHEVIIHCLFLSQVLPETVRLMSRYFEFSRSAYYAVVASLPLLLAYELLLALDGGGITRGQVRNAPEVWLRSLMESLGISPSNATLVMILVLILAIPVVRKHSIKLEASYFGAMLLEALVYGFLLGIIINYILAFLFTFFQPALVGMALPLPLVEPLVEPLAVPLAALDRGGIVQGLALSLGAGLFEELFFRVVLLNALLAGFRAVLPGWIGTSISIVLAAFLFSLAHYVGSLGDDFELYGFLYRWFAGLIFTVLYYLRGFAITAYAHAIYDILVVTGLFRIVGI